QSSGGFSPDVWYECDGVRVTQVTSPFFSHIESFTGPTPQKQVVWVLVDGFPLATEVGLYANCAGPPLPPTLIANTFPHSSYFSAPFTINGNKITYSICTLGVGASCSQKTAPLPKCQP